MLIPEPDISIFFVTKGRLISLLWLGWQLPQINI